AKKETKPKASAKTKASATKKRPAAADPETSEIPTVVTAETENAYCNANEGDGGFRLRPYKQTKAMAIQRTTGQKNQVLQVKVRNASFEQNTSLAQTLLELLREGKPLEEVLELKNRMCIDLETEIAWK
ncbi:unnamed protein product, partial [Symbiodinium microadriaticum]